MKKCYLMLFVALLMAYPYATALYANNDFAIKINVGSHSFLPITTATVLSERWKNASAAFSNNKHMGLGQTIQNKNSLAPVKLSNPIVVPGKRNALSNKAKIDKNKYKNILSNQPVRFLENKGQMADMEGKPVPFVLFKEEAQGMDMYITETGLTYVFMEGGEK